MSQARTTLYAESLSNIRQVSIVATLPAPSDTSTTVKLLKKHGEGVRFELNQGNAKLSIELPGLVDDDSALHIPQPGKTELSWRLPVTTSAVKTDDLESGYVTQGWSAKALRPGISLLCRQCSEVIISQNVVKEWKDLPSENWAEMMEFWHCHKPEDKPDHEQSHGTGSNNENATHTPKKDENVNRAYGANSRFSARPGVGFIDILTFLLAEADCKNIKRDATSEARYQGISCAACSVSLGYYDPRAGGIKLFKWRLQTSIGNSAENVHSSTSAQASGTVSSICLYTEQFASILASQVTSKLILMPLNEPSVSTTTPSHDSKHAIQYLSLWILSPSIHYSFFGDGKGVAIAGQHAMKVFFQIPTTKEAEALAEKQDVEEVFLPVQSIEDIRHALMESSSRLPQSARKFGPWEVGLLERFSMVDG